MIFDLFIKDPQKDDFIYRPSWVIDPSIVGCEDITLKEKKICKQLAV